MQATDRCPRCDAICPQVGTLSEAGAALCVFQCPDCRQEVAGLPVAYTWARRLDGSVVESTPEVD